MALLMAVLSVGAFVVIFLVLSYGVVNLAQRASGWKTDRQVQQEHDRQVQLTAAEHMRRCELAGLSESATQAMHDRSLELAQVTHNMQKEIKELSIWVDAHMRAYRMAEELIHTDSDTALVLMNRLDASLSHYKTMGAPEIAASRVEPDALKHVLSSPVKEALAEQKLSMLTEANDELRKERIKSSRVAIDNTSFRPLSTRRGYCNNCNTLRRVDSNHNCVYCGKSVEETVLI